MSGGPALEPFGANPLAYVVPEQCTQERADRTGNDDRDDIEIPRAAENPASGMISSEGTGGKTFSANMRSATPMLPVRSTSATIQSNIGFGSPSGCRAHYRLSRQRCRLSRVKRASGDPPKQSFTPTFAGEADGILTR